MSRQLHKTFQPEAPDQRRELRAERPFAPDDHAHIWIPVSQEGRGPDEVTERLLRSKVADGSEDSDLPDVTAARERCKLGRVDTVWDDKDTLWADPAVQADPRGGRL